MRVLSQRTFVTPRFQNAYESGMRAAHYQLSEWAAQQDNRLSRSWKIFYDQQNHGKPPRKPNWVMRLV